MATDVAPARPKDPSHLQPADVIVTVASCTTAVEVDAAARAAQDAVGPLKTVLLHPDVICQTRPGDEGAVPPVVLLPSQLPPVGRLPLLPTAGRDLFRPIADVVERTGAKACAIVGARPDGITSEMIGTLVQPVLERGIDLVLPSYTRHRLDGLINNAIVNPLTRALYGRRVDGQLGVDFGFSARLVQALARHEAPGRERCIWPLTEAVTRDMPVGQAHLHTSPAPVESTPDLSTALADVLGSLFEDMDVHAAVWQKMRVSQPVPAFGQPAPLAEERRAVDHRAMVESFHLGLRNLKDVWSLVLPPATLIEVGRLARLDADAFHLPPTLWARLIFDFALGYRLRAISRDHLLRAITPLYLAWVASFVLDVGAADRAAAADRLEQICRAFESEKPYLLARWRWPDRFHP